MPHKPTWIVLSLLTFCVLAVLFWAFIPIGWVGEVTSFWTDAPQTSHSEAISCIADLCLYSTRPVVRWNGFPIWHNVYTASFPDWIHYIWFQATSNTNGIRILQLLFSTALIVQLCMWSKHLLSEKAQWILWLWMMNDWSFLFYKKALGTTEIGLQWALMLSVLILLQPKRFNTKYLAGVIGMGIWCKVTFALAVLPLLGLLYWIPKEDRARYGIHILFGAVIGLLPHLLLLYWTSQIDIPVRSHDFWTLQWERILSALTGGNTSIREQNWNVWTWLFDPLQFFTKAYGVASIPWHGWGKIIVYLGALLAGWQLRSNIQWQRLTWGLFSIVILLIWIAKDLHHLAMATPLLGLWLVYTFDQVSWKAPPLLVMGGLWFGTQIWTLTDAPKIINAVETPTFSEMRQQALEDLITQNDDIQRLITMDYEVYGVLEARMTWLPVTHMWPQISTERWDALPKILLENKGSHLLVLKSSMPMIYNLQPSEQRLQRIGQEVGVSIERVGHVDGMWLYRLDDPLSTEDNEH